MIAIETFKLTKRYKKEAAVVDLDLKIRNGELYSLLGVNGAGKTTTIKMLSCLIKPSSGYACILGNNIIDRSQEVKGLINVSPQETAVAPNLTVNENLEMIAGIYGFPKLTGKQKAIDIQAAFRLMNVSKMKACSLSGGMQRRLSIAMAMISEPKILILDEPTLGLDVIARRELWAAIEALKGKVTMMLTTHYMEEAQALSDRIGIMAKGRLVAEGSPEELISLSGKNNFEDAFIALATLPEKE